jgi:hypothetical protein
VVVVSQEDGVKKIEIQPIEQEPSAEEFRQYPDYLIGCLLREGVGMIEADREHCRDDKVDFVFTLRKTGESKIIGSLTSGLFRSMLARLGPRCGADEMLYAGHTLFTCKYEREGSVRLHRFSLFVCNEPTMGVWLRLYLYAIDGI